MFCLPLGVGCFSSRMLMHNLFVYKSKNILCKLTSLMTKTPFKIKTAVSY